MTDSRQADQADDAPTPDDTEPTSERQAELRAAVEANTAAGNPPFEQVEVRTRGELRWAIRELGWQTEGLQAMASDARHADLRGVTLEHSILGDIELRSVDLTGANLRKADLRGARLTWARCEGAYLWKTDLRGTSATGVVFLAADLRGAQLAGATLTGSSFERAKLDWIDATGAGLANINLRGACLELANLSGADLRGAQCDTTTTFADVTIDTHTRLADIGWNGASLAHIGWEKAPSLGDEAGIADADTAEDRLSAIRETARMYHELAALLRQGRVYGPAARYRLRAEQLDRRAAWQERRYGAWLWSALLDGVSGYGERPLRLLIAYLALLVVGAAVYFALGLAGAAGGVSPLVALLLSVTALHGRGFIPVSAGALGQPEGVVSVVESLCGLFLGLVFLATLCRRFLRE